MVIGLHPNIFPDSLSGKRRAPVPTKWTLLLEYRMIMLELPIFHTDIDAVWEIKIICYLEIKYCHALKDFFQFPQTQESLQYFFSYSLTRTLLLLPILYKKYNFVLNIHV